MKLLKSKIKMLMKTMIRAVLGVPSLREGLLPIVKRFPAVYLRLKRINYSIDPNSNSRKDVVLSEDGLELYLDLKIVMEPCPKRPRLNMEIHHANRD